MRALIVPVMAALAFTVPAYAQTASPAATPETTPAKISFQGGGETILNIAATERVQVQQDLLIASLRIERENADAKTVQAEINELMKKAVDTAKTVPTVKVATGQYYVYQYDPNPNPQPLKSGEKPALKWRGTQTLDLKSTNADDLLKLAGALQDSGLIMNGLSYTLSPEKADEAKDNLMEAALAKVKARAERAAAAMGKAKTDLIEVTVDTADNMVHPPMMMRAVAMDAGGAMEKAAPSAEPGETEITLTVSARALLK